MISNKYYQTIPHCSLKLSTELAVDITTGTGINFSDPFNPVSTTFHPFQSKKLSSDSPYTVQDAIKVDVRVEDDLTEEQESYLMHAHFKASYTGFGGLEAARTQVRKEAKKQHNLYVFIRRIGDGVRINEDDINWNDENKKHAEIANNEVDEKTRINYFVRKLGTHYVDKIIMGYEIIIKASYSHASKIKKDKFKGDLQSTIGAFKVGGSINIESSSSLSQSGTEITASINAGGIEPEYPRALSSIQSVSDFLNKIAGGEVKITPGPIEVTLKSYWETLANYPTLFNDFREVEHFASPDPIHGVLRGTIVAWSPTSENIKDDPINIDNQIIVIPGGWTICDGDGAPDLTNKFIMGGINLHDIMRADDNPLHDHKLTCSKAKRSADNSGLGYRLSRDWRDGGMNSALRKSPPRSHERAALHGHIHSISIEPTNALPPYQCLIYIMKK